MTNVLRKVLGRPHLHIAGADAQDTLTTQHELKHQERLNDLRT